MIGINRQIGKFPLPVFFAISNIKLSVDIILIPCGGHEHRYFVIVRLTVQCCVKITDIKTGEF